MALTIPDISEWQGTPDLSSLRGKAVIIRLHNGYRADRTGAANRAHAHACGVRAVGLYGYVVAATDPTQQGRAFAAAIGKLAAGEFIVADMEEGAGDQSARVKDYLTAVHQTLKDNNPDEFIYSGLNFWETHLGQVPASLAHRWVAAYQTQDPHYTAEELWQFTDSYTWPWGRSDASTFTGTVDELLALLAPITARAAGSGPTPTMENLMWLIEGEGGVIVWWNGPYRGVVTEAGANSLAWFKARGVEPFNNPAMVKWLDSEIQAGHVRAAPQF